MRGKRILDRGGGGLPLFLSYSREDRQMAADVVSDLEQFGHQVWIDEKLSGGQEWWRQILGQIRSSEAFILILSRASIASQACELETTYARELRKKIILARLDGVEVTEAPASLAAIIATIHWIEYRSNDKGSAIRLLKAVSDLPPSELPDPLPAEPPVPGSYLTDLLDKIDSPRELTKGDQLELVFELRKRVAGKRDRKDIERLLVRFAERDDLLARIAAQIDELLGEVRGRPAESQKAVEDSPAVRGPAAAAKQVRTPGLRNNWRAEKVARTQTALVLRVRLANGEYLLEWNANSLLPGGFVKVDGEVVSKSSALTAETHRFEITDGAQTHKAELSVLGMMSCKFTLKVGGRVLFSD